MSSAAALRIDPVVLDTCGSGTDIEVFVPYTEWSLADAVLKRAETLTAGLNPTVRLVAVQSVPYVVPFGCPASTHAYLVEQLIDLACHCPMAVNPEVVVARSQEEGFHHALKPRSIVLIGTRKGFLRTREEKLARTLAQEGFQVSLLHVE